MLVVRCRAAIDQMGDDISGFALAIWDQEGHLRSAYDATRGPIRAPLVPRGCFVSNEWAIGSPSLCGWPWRLPPSEKTVV
jgi:hypothetical protein